MFDRLAELETELEKLEARLSEIYASGDQHGRARSRPPPSPSSSRSSTRTASYRATEPTSPRRARCSRGEADAEMREYLEAEIDAKEARARRARGAAQGAARPARSRRRASNVIVEIRGAEGGEEANLWAGDLFRMYERYADRHRWKIEVLVEPAVRHGRLPRRHVRGEGRRRVVAAQARGAARTGCSGCR